MILFWSATSPFARKVMITAHELGIAKHIELIPTVTADEPPELLKVNPSGKLPVLLTKDCAIPNSPLICEYLITRFGGGTILAATGSERWKLLAFSARADAMIDAAFLVRMEKVRAQQQQSEDWISRQMGKLHRSLDHFEAEAPDLTGNFDAGQIALAAAIGWLVLRFGDHNIFATRPALGEWFARVSMITSMKETEPLK